MKKLLLIFFLFSAGANNKLIAQDSVLVEGFVSFVNANNIYVRFENTKDLNINDTLLVFVKEKWTKSLVVQMVSSKSIVSVPFGPERIMVGSKVAYYKKPTISENEPIKVVEIKKEPDEVVIPKEEKPKEHKQNYNGRIIVSTNGSMEQKEKDYNRIRTSLAFDINNINNGKFSFESYINYRRRFGVEQNQDSFNEDFKIYALNLSYQANENSTISLGRKLNNRMANMGAIDGLQVEQKFKSLTFGGFGGTRPDDIDYGFNSNLLQFGAFASIDKDKGKGQISTSIAFANQLNHLKTDRRFVYFQHTNSIINNLYLFYSIELDLFQNIDSVKSNSVNLTSTYVSLRYKPFKKFSVTTSYDNRRNVIYYETYRTYLEQLLNQETRQGVRLNVNYNITRNLNFNATGFYRYQESRPDPTKNYIANFTVNRLPAINASLNLNVNYMNTYYFDGVIYGARFNKDLFKGKLSTELNYRKVDYRFFNKEQPNMKQDIVGISANVYTKKRTSLMINYEGTFEPTQSYNRYYVTISQRIKNKK